MYTPQAYRPISRKRMNSVLERKVVNGVGLGEVDGLFNIGKMFTRMFHFTPKSFTLKNIAGAIGSVSLTGMTLGLAPKITSQHSKIAQYVGYGEMAAAAAVGAVYGGAALLGPATGTALTGTAGTIGTAAAGSTEIAAALAPTVATAGWSIGGVASAIGSGLSTVGSGLMTAMQALPLIGGLLGGGGGGVQQGGMTQAEYDAQQKAAYDAGQQQVQMYQPNAAYGSGVPISYVPETGQPSMTGMNASYGDLRTPYTGVTQDGEQVQVDPRTGQVISEGMPTGMMIAIGGVTVLAGWYLMSGNKSNN